MTEENNANRILDFALRIGEMLLANGAGAADVESAMDAVAHHLGVRPVQVSVTFTTITISHHLGPDFPASTLTRHVKHRESDFADVTAIDHLVRNLINGSIDLDEARSELAQITSTGHPTPRWAITLSWGVIGAGVSILLGGNWTVIAIAALAGCSIEVLQRRLVRLRLPFFYSQAAGGLLATLLAVFAAATDLPVDPSLVVTASIVMLLAGLGFIGAIQDALTGFYVTANARVMEVMIATTGIIVGVSAGLSVGRALGVDLSLDPGRAGLAHLPEIVIGSAITAAGFAYSAWSPARILLPIAAVAGATGGLSYGLVDNGVGKAAAAGIAAIIIGFVSYGIAGWGKVPPLVIVVSAIVPLLPGLSIYRALSLLAAEDILGIFALFTAAAIAVSLSSGVILGEYIAQPLGREARKIEQRLAGPRLVGPLRVRQQKRKR